MILSMIFITTSSSGMSSYPPYHQKTSYLQNQFARPIIGHHREVVEVLNKDLVGQNVAAVLSAFGH